MTRPRISVLWQHVSVCKGYTSIISVFDCFSRAVMLTLISGLFLALPMPLGYTTLCSTYLRCTNELSVSQLSLMANRLLFSPAYQHTSLIPEPVYSPPWAPASQRERSLLWLIVVLQVAAPHGVATRGSIWADLDLTGVRTEPCYSEGKGVNVNLSKTPGGIWITFLPGPLLQKHAVLFKSPACLTDLNSKRVEARSLGYITYCS